MAGDEVKSIYALSELAFSWPFPENKTGRKGIDHFSFHDPKVPLVLLTSMPNLLRISELGWDYDVGRSSISSWAWLIVLEAIDH